MIDTHENGAFGSSMSSDIPLTMILFALLQVGGGVLIVVAIMRLVRKRTRVKTWIRQPKTFKLPYVMSERRAQTNEIFVQALPEDISVDWSVKSFATAQSAIPDVSSQNRGASPVFDLEEGTSHTEGMPAVGRMSISRAVSMPYGLAVDLHQVKVDELSPVIRASRCFSTSGETVDGTEVQERARKSLIALNMDFSGKRVTPMPLLLAPL